MSATEAGLLPEEDGLPEPGRTFAISAVLVAFNLSVVMGTIANIALPTIARHLGIADAEAIWVINAYQLGLIVVLLPLSSLADQIGYRPIYLFGLSAFVLGTGVCGFSSSFGQLLLGRALQGVGAAAIQSVYVSSISQIFPRKLVGRGVGLGTLTSQICAMAAPSLAAFVLLFAPWQWLFLMVLPFGVAAWWISRAVMPATAGSGEAFDWKIALISVFTFGLLALGLDGVLRGPDRGTGALLLLAGLVIGALQIRLERGKLNPIIPVDLLRMRPFSYTMLGTFLGFGASGIIMVALPFLLEGEMGYSTQATGLVMTVSPVFMALCGFCSGWLFNGCSPSRLGAMGLAVMAVGLLGLGLAIAGHAAAPVLVLCLALAGGGFGTFVSPNLRAIILITPPGRSGAASGAQAAARLFGQLFGAILVALALAHPLQGSGASALFAAAALAGLAAVMSALRKIAAPS